MHIRNMMLLLAPVLLLGQPTSNVVSVTVSDPSNAQPDQAVLNLMVTSGIDKNLGDIVAAVTGLGVTAANLTSVSSGNVGDPLGSSQRLVWYFQLTVPLAKLKDTTASLTALQKTISQANSDLALSFTIQQTQVSVASQTCDVRALVSNARAQAQKIVGSAGLTPGPIVGITSSISDSAPDCALNVRFALGGMIGQPGPYVMTIASTRTNHTPPDQAVINIDVTSGVTASLDDISAALTGVGIIGATFWGERNSAIIVDNKYQDALDWGFTSTVALAKLKDTLGPLDAAQQNIGKQNSGLTLSYYVQGAQVSMQAHPSCPDSDLMAEARTQAQKVAVAAGVTAGAILSVYDTGSSALPPAILEPSLYGTISEVLNAPTTGCGLTVQFQLQ